MKHSPAWVTLALFAHLFVPCGIAHADNEILKTVLSPEFQNEAKRAVELARSRSRVRSMSARNNSGGPQVYSIDPEAVSALPITMHLRGTRGIELPTAAALRSDRQKREPLNETAIHQASVRMSQASGRAYRKTAAAGPLPDCTFDRSVALPKNPPDGVEPDKILIDVLFAKRASIPEDPPLKLPSSVDIVTFSGASLQGPMLSARGLGARCLPTRIQIRPNGRTVMEGLLAFDEHGVEKSVVQHGASSFEELQKQVNTWKK